MNSSGRGFSIFPDIQFVFLGGLLLISSISMAYLTIKSWVVGTSGPMDTGDVLEEAFGIFVVAFVCCAAILLLLLLREKILIRSNGWPTKGHTIFLVLIWACGVSGVITIAGVIFDWTGLTGGVT
ncbi:MAG: hypothetical protein AB8C13_09675 [Phycisphaerales bacterium]